MSDRLCLPEEKRGHVLDDPLRIISVYVYSRVEHYVNEILNTRR